MVRPEKIHGLLFDGAVFFTNPVLIGYIPRLEETTDNPRAGVFLFAAVITQIAGALLKAGPLNQRMARNHTGGESGWFMKVLLFLLFIQFTTVSLFGFTLLGELIGRSPREVLDNSLWVILSLFIGAVTLFVVWRAGEGDPSRSNKQYPAWIEFGADFLLWISVTILTQVFWVSLVGLLEPGQIPGLGVVSVILLIAYSLLFIFFYLPSRYLFLIEDSRSPYTWLQAWAAMLPVAWLVLVG